MSNKKENFKKKLLLKTNLIVGIILIIITYLGFALSIADLNITYWGEMSRVTFAVLEVVIIGILAVKIGSDIYNINLKDYEDRN